MRAVVQRVTNGSVSIEGEEVAGIGPGLLILICAVRDDGEQDADFLARKIARLRIFADADGKINLAIGDVGGEALVVSQFTLAADWRKGNRPGFSAAAPPKDAQRLYEYFCERLRHEGVPVQTGRFGAAMQVRLINDGPFTLSLDTDRP